MNEECSKNFFSPQIAEKRGLQTCIWLIDDKQKKAKQHEYEIFSENETFTVWQISKWRHFIYTVSAKKRQMDEKKLHSQDKIKCY